jgi:putative transposase
METNWIVSARKPRAQAITGLVLSPEKLNRRADAAGELLRDLLPGNWIAVSWKIPVLTRARRNTGTMRRTKFSEGQIAYILRQAEEGTVIGEVCRKAGISEATFYVWRKKYAGLMPSEMKRLKQLEEENGKLKKIVADLSLDKAMLQDVLSRKI